MIEDEKSSDPLAKQWKKRLDRAIKEREDSQLERKYRDRRKLVKGDIGGGKDQVNVNIVHSNFAAILPQIYAKNPEIAVTPTEAASDNRYAWVKPFCLTMQAVINRVFIVDGKLKPRAKSAIRSAMTTGIGWVKVSWQNDIKTDPLIQERIADTQDNVRRMEALLAEIEEDEEKRCEVEASLAELNQQLAALGSGAEVSVVEGVAVDRPLTEDIFVLDDTITDWDSYLQADAIAHRVWMTEERYEEVFGKDAPKGATKYNSDRKENKKSQDGAPDLIAVFEVWHKLDNSVYTIAAGASEFAREPYIPVPIGERFYPFFGLAFNPVDGSLHPLSDSELLYDLQVEYSRTRTDFSNHRRENLPVHVYNKSSGITKPELDNIANRKANEFIGISSDPNSPIRNSIDIFENVPIDPANYDVTPILRDAEMLLGAGDASKGFINKAKTATEADIMAQGLQSRISDRQDVVEDWISEMALYAAEVCLQSMTKAQVQRIAGPDAVWPEGLSKDEIFDLVSISIRAGSAGKPNKMQEREQWAQLLPQIKEAIAQVAQLREANHKDMADATQKLVEETLRRFDERIDLEEFLPKDKGEEPQIPPQVAQQMQAMQQQLQQLSEENKALKSQAEQKLIVERERIAMERELGFEKIRSNERVEAMRIQQPYQYKGPYEIV